MVNQEEEVVLILYPLVTSMTIKLILDYLQSIGYMKVEVNLERSIVVVNTTNNFVITHFINGYTAICVKDLTDTRFKGIIENVQELKGVLRLISKIK